MRMVGGEENDEGIRQYESVLPGYKLSAKDK